MFSTHETAAELIAALADETAKSVDKDIKAHAQVWANKPDKEQGEAANQAIMWATREAGHRTTCPSCGCAALLRGTAVGPVTTKIDDDIVAQTQMVLPSTFECVACGLRIAGLPKLRACGLGDAYTATSLLSPADFFGLYTEDELEDARNTMPDVELDFNC